MEIKMENIYWNHKGKYQALSEKLQKLIPLEGGVKGSKNKKLERFRKATHFYYDLYNNGLCNNVRGFSKFFNVCLYAHIIETRGYWKIYDSHLYILVESKIDQIILEAAIEQSV
jgi:hypothetical protein